MWGLASEVHTPLLPSAPQRVTALTRPPPPPPSGHRNDRFFKTPKTHNPEAGRPKCTRLGVQSRLVQGAGGRGDSCGVPGPGPGPPRWPLGPGPLPASRARQARAGAARGSARRTPSSPAGGAPRPPHSPPTGGCALRSPPHAVGPGTPPARRAPARSARTARVPATRSGDRAPRGGGGRGGPAGRVPGPSGTQFRK